jgi:hypothetical protein
MPKNALKPVLATLLCILLLSALLLVTGCGNFTRAQAHRIMVHRKLHLPKGIQYHLSHR